MFVYKKNKTIENIINLDYIKNIKIGTMVKFSTYYAIGGFRFIKPDNSLFNTGSVVKDTLLIGDFQNLKTTASTGYSSASTYYVGNVFNSSRPMTGSYTNLCYWLSSTASTISASFNTPIQLKGVQFTPRPDSGNQVDRGLTSFKMTVTYADNTTKLFSFSSTDATRNKIFKIMF